MQSMVRSLDHFVSNQSMELDFDHHLCAIFGVSVRWNPGNAGGRVFGEREPLSAGGAEADDGSCSERAF